VDHGLGFTCVDDGANSLTTCLAFVDGGWVVPSVVAVEGS
jgi:hypothetical protein